MAINDNGTDGFRMGQLGPGEVPLLLKKSDYRCSGCGDVPPVAPDGRLVSAAVQLPDEDKPSLHCMKCMNRWNALTIRANVPLLIKIDDQDKV